MFGCLHTVDAAILANAALNVSLAGLFGTWHFTPVVDGEFIVGPPKSDAGVRDVAIPPHLVPLVKDPSVDFSLFPLENPGIVSIPLAFFLGWLGTVTSRPEPDHEAKATEMEVRALTGAGAEGAVDH